MEKRGQAIQFNWMFVVIAGAILLLFFTVFTVKYIDLQQKRTSAELGRGLDQVFIGSKSITQYKTFSLESEVFGIDFECDSFIVNDYYTQKSDYVLFGNDVEATDELIIWSREFKKPFRIDNIVYILDPKKKIYTNDFGFKNSFPEGVEFTDQNEADIGVFFDTCPNFSGKKICVQNGNIKFDSGETYVHYDDALLYGATVSDYDNFKCAVDKLEKKWSNLLRLYSKKTEYLPVCDYTSIKGQLDSASFEDLSDGLSNGADLVNLNSDLMGRGCEVVF